MSILRIDNASDIDPASITFTSLRWHYGTGIAISSGTGIYKKSGYRNGVMTDLGDIKESTWCELAEKLIQDSHEQWLLDALFLWEQEHNYAKKSKAELRVEALYAHIRRIFDDPKWAYFIPFNRRFRPAALEHAHIVTVITDCCGLPGEVTQEQVDHAYGGYIFCPLCGRSSLFKLVVEEKTNDRPCSEPNGFQRGENAFEQLLNAMEIPLLNCEGRRSLCRHFDEKLEKFEAAILRRFDFSQLPGCEGALNQSIYQWFEDEEHWYLLEKCKALENKGKPKNLINNSETDKKEDL